MILGFGEIMLRVNPVGTRRFLQALPGMAECTFGGGEANVCASLAILGVKTRYLTALPKHQIADAVVKTLRGLGVDTGAILRRDAGRLGIYFLEAGANQLPSTVVYDREFSAVSLAEPAEYDLDVALEGVTHVHLTGITPSLGRAAHESTVAVARKAKERGCTVSCDLNYRKKLWRWEAGTQPRDLARRCMTEILPSVDLVIGNEEDAHQVLGIEARDTQVEGGQVDARAYPDVAREICRQFSNVSQVAITLRESFSASHNGWGAMLYESTDDAAYFAPLDEEGNYQPWQIRQIIDRVGGGDSFAAGLFFALLHEKQPPERAIATAVAASCLKHSIDGDMNYATAAQIAALAGGQATGRVQR